MVVTITTRMMWVSIVHKQCYLATNIPMVIVIEIISLSARYNVWWKCGGNHVKANISKHRKVSAISIYIYICFLCHESWVSKVQLDLPTAWLPLAVCWTHGERDCLHMTQWDFQTVYCFRGSACYTSHCHRHFGHHNSCYHWLVMCWSRC